VAAVVFSEVDKDGFGALAEALAVLDGAGEVCVVGVCNGTSDLVIVTALTLTTVDAASTTLVGVTK
jgi:hypothetical protein